MAQYSITACLHCSPLQLHQREQLAPQLSATVPVFFLSFMLDHSQPTSLFPNLLHSCLKNIHVTQNALELLCRVSVQQLARDVVRGVTLTLAKLVNAANRVHIVNELVL
ncbi:hypothetical protein TRVL_09902 [Trypanosoma vivax]|nr:hypothetical protein TRVL_09902 [Trypanosoma vivax]